MEESIIGKQFGMLIPIRISSQAVQGQTFYLCKCTRCGSFINDVYERDIVEYKVRCCNNCDRHDLTGMRFGRLTVVRKYGSTKFNATLWECICDCGTTKVIRGDGLVSRHIVSCGCYKIDSKTIDLVGKRFGRLLVVDKTEKRDTDGGIIWKCLCDCGATVEIPSNRLLRGHTRSCGCYARDRSSEVHTKWKTTPEKILAMKYHGMMSRCYNPKNDSYKDYGEKGVIVCDEWKNPINGERNFVNWGISTGFQIGKSIDRINDGAYKEQQDGPYAPWNCRWGTPKLQANNRRNNVRITIDGITYTLAEWIDMVDPDNNYSIRKLHDHHHNDRVEKLISDLYCKLKQQ